MYINVWLYFSSILRTAVFRSTCLDKTKKLNDKRGQRKELSHQQVVTLLQQQSGLSVVM